MKSASAQVKSAILLASLATRGKTVIIEPEPCRDHTEIMMKSFGLDIKIEKFDMKYMNYLMSLSSAEISQEDKRRLTKMYKNRIEKAFSGMATGMLGVIRGCFCIITCAGCLGVKSGPPVLYDD